MKKLFIGLMCLGLFAACSDDKAGKDKETKVGYEDTTTDMTVAPEMKTEIELKAGDEIKYIGSTEYDVPVGETITLSLSHIGKMDAAAMGHNTVVLTKGADIDAFAQEAQAAKENDYIPEGNENMVAHTKLLGGGESDTITFTLTEEGDYPFLCSFPAHFIIMRGVIHAKNKE